MSNREKLLASAQKNLQKGQIAKAIKDYQQIIASDPKDIRNRQKLAELLCRAGLNAEALGEYAAVAGYYGDNGFYLKAIAVYKQMQKLDPEQINVYHRLAELNVKQGLVGNAMAEYRNLLTFFERKKLLSEAIGVLQKMAELEPDNLNIQVKIAESFARAGLRDKAWAEFSQVLDQLREARDFSRIVKLYEIILPLFPIDPEMRAGFAEALVRQGDYDQGLQILKDLFHANPDNRRILSALAFAYRECEDFENERLTYHHLLKQIPGDLELREAFIRACLDGGEYLRALAELEEWKEAFFDADRSSVLKVFYEELLEIFPENEQVRRGLTMVYEQTGDGENRFDTSAFVAASSTDASREVDVELTATDFHADAVCDTAPSVEPNEAGEASLVAEEIPLEFLESAVVPVDLLSFGQPPASSTGSLPVDNALESVAEEMEFELELVLDDPLLAVGSSPEPTAPSEADAVPEVETDFAEIVPADALEDLEELVELDASEDLDELTSAELPEQFEPEPVGVGSLDDVLTVASGGGLTNFELGELLSDLESASAVKNVRDEFEEAEFYLQQGLLDDAERVFRQILEFDADCTAAREKMIEIAARRKRSQPSVEHDPELMILSAEAVDGTPQEVLGQRAIQPETDRARHDEGFDAFKIGVETPIDVEDTESHYNLGIAYKEMGLFDEAVAEFDKALKNPGRMVDSLALKGTCLFMKGDFEQAEKVFKSGLVYPGLNADERISLYYEMGLLYEAWGRPLEALDSFQLVADADLFYRSVGEKIEEIRKMLGLDVNADKEDIGAGGNRGRVSYI